jgi:formylglycine-generating enzyme required for sulfatase activity
MHGNVMQWCEVNSDILVPVRRAEVPLSSLRVLRGGDWYDGPTMSRGARRFTNLAAFHSNFTGVRVCFHAD